jgi:tripartite-type tricarboxylate transporter receptor subunit TctC
MTAPPGVPLERVKVLRDAYAKALKDPDLLAEVEKSRLDLEPSTGEEIQTLQRELLNQPREVIDRVKRLLEY